MQEFVEATKENSGLDLGKLGEQPGNTSPTALGEVKTPQGDDVSGDILHTTIEALWKVQILRASLMRHHLLV